MLAQAQGHLEEESQEVPVLVMVVVPWSLVNWRVTIVLVWHGHHSTRDKHFLLFSKQSSREAPEIIYMLKRGKKPVKMKKPREELLSLWQVAAALDSTF